MASENGRAPRAPRVESGAADAVIDLQKILLTDQKRTETFQVFASQCFYGDEEQQLASPHVTFTHFEDSKNPSWSGSVISFVLRRRKDNQVMNLNLQHSCIRVMSFSSDVHMGAMVILNIPPVTSLALQHNLQMGIQHRQITENLPPNLDGLHCHLTFILKHCPGHPDMYMSLGLEGHLKDYKTFLEHAKKCETLRDTLDREKGFSKKAILARSSYPHLPYFTTMFKTELEELLGFIGLVPQKDREGNVVYGPGKVDKDDLTEDSTLLCFPKNAPNNVHITVKDMQKTAMGQLLNDNIIEFGIKFVFHGLHGEELRSATHAFCTFFFSSFAANPKDNKQGNIFLPANTDWRKKYLKDTYAKVRRWTRKVDIFKKKYIVIPVNNGVHWYLIVIVNPGKALRNKDDPIEDPALMDPEDLCQLILFDSLPDPKDPKRACILQIMRDYLECEFDDKKTKSEPNLFFSSQHMVQVRLRGLPVQKNLVDCGVYLLAYLEFYMHKPPKVPQNRIVEVAEWCNYCRLGFIEFYRNKIIARIKKLCGSQIWSKFEKFEREAQKQDPQTARVTVYSESDLVNLGRRPRRHECRSRFAHVPPPCRPQAFSCLQWIV